MTADRMLRALIEIRAALPELLEDAEREGEWERRYMEAMDNLNDQDARMQRLLDVLDLLTVPAYKAAMFRNTPNDLTKELLRGLEAIDRARGGDRG